jgi:hypothetical protein
MGRKRKRPPGACVGGVPTHLVPPRHLHHSLHRRPRQAVGLSMTARPSTGAQWRAASYSLVGARDPGSSGNRIPAVLHLLPPQPIPRTGKATRARGGEPHRRRGGSATGRGQAGLRGAVGGVELPLAGSTSDEETIKEPT